MTEMRKDKIEAALTAVVERLKHLQRPEQEAQLLQLQKNSNKIIGAFSRDFGMEPWDWPQGVGLYGLMNLYKGTKDEQILEYIEQWFQRHLSEGLPKQNINTTCPLLTLVDLVPHNPEYYKLCDDWAEWIINELPKTKEGGFQHTTTKDAAKGLLNMNEGQMWIDTLFMTVLFLAKWGVYTDNQTYIDEAVHQYLMMIKYLYEKKSGLFYHAWSFPENSNFGEVFWCRGNCWYTASALEFIEILGERLDTSVRQMILTTYQAQVESLCKLQAKSGLWHTVLDDQDSYEETSGSAGIAYGILKGIRSKALGEEYREIVNKAIEGILSQIGEDGTVAGVSAGTPVGRDAEHYKQIITAPMAYGQALCIMALSEALK